MTSENPYQSPLVDTDGESAQEGRSVAWMLFSSKGRISRRDFWAWGFAILTVHYVLSGLAILGSGPGTNAAIASVVLSCILVFWVFFTVHLKRWHDRDKSVLWLLLWLIPVLGPIWVFIETGCMRGTIGPNRYGADPTQRRGDKDDSSEPRATTAAENTEPEI